jgi:hypothetical protein
MNFSYRSVLITAAVAYAMDQPPEMDVGEIVVRPVSQGL